SDRWVECELANFLERWEGLFRGRARVKSASELAASDLEDYHLVCWGTPQSNSAVRRVFAEWQKRAASGAEHPIGWKNGTIRVGAEEFDAAKHILSGVYPNPLSSAKYVVLNSGVTFRQAHDRTNSLQNPHLPDWAVIGLDQPPTAETPGRIVRAGFFDQNWQYSPKLSW
ncbi:MAG TPA: hypothetical protein DDW52_13025, partial [Planctomycetaceae bacterium]|nr:hypothetical protein [Planctomycetaceae bacterium]